MGCTQLNQLSKRHIKKTVKLVLRNFKFKFLAEKMGFLCGGGLKTFNCKFFLNTILKVVTQYVLAS